jgi:hypothetical protein
MSLSWDQAFAGVCVSKRDFSRPIHISRRDKIETQHPLTAIIPTEKPKRGRGAPLGNTNNLRHGFYSRRFKPVELKGLEACEPINLKDEIELLRVYVRRVVEMAGDTQDLYTAIDILRALSFATSSLTRLIRAQHLIGEGADSVGEALIQALKEVKEEMGLP